MSKSNTSENAFLLLLYNATTWANVAINATSSPLTNIWLALYTSDPGEAGSANTNECAYTSYARVAVARPAGFTVSGNTVTLAADATFPTATGGTETVTHWATVSTASGAGTIFHSGTVSPTIAVSTGVTPKLLAATSISED